MVKALEERTFFLSIQGFLRVFHSRNKAEMVDSPENALKCILKEVVRNALSDALEKSKCKPAIGVEHHVVLDDRKLGNSTDHIRADRLNTFLVFGFDALDESIDPMPGHEYVISGILKHGVDKVGQLHFMIP